MEETMPAFFYLGTPVYRWEKIKIEGILPSNASRPGKEKAVYLSNQISMAEHYASMNFGEDEPLPWAILEIDTAFLNVSLLHADNGHEADLNADHIIARGYTLDQIHSGDFPWHVSMQETGQALYLGAIPVAAIKMLKEV